MLTGAIIGAGLFFTIMLLDLWNLNPSREQINWSKVTGLAIALPGCFAFWGWVVGAVL